VGTCHDGRELDVRADLEEPDADANDLLIGRRVDWSRIGGKIEQVHCVWCLLNREGVRAEGSEGFDDGMIHGRGEGSSGGVVVEAHAEVSVHDGFVKGAGVAVAEGSEGFCVLCLPGKDHSSIINVGIDDNELGGVSRADDAELARVGFELGVAEGENCGRMIVVEDLVGSAGSIDAAEDSNICIAVGWEEVRWKSAVVRSGQWSLQECSGDVIAA